MRPIKTENCVICGKPAKYWHGYVVSFQLIGHDGYISEKIIAGFCDKHVENESEDGDGFYGAYDNGMMGRVILLFERKQI